MKLWSKKATGGNQPATYDAVQAKLEAIVTEMKRSGFWQDTPLKPEQYQFQQAFAMDTMAYSQWLQFIFVPRVQAIIDQHGQFPRQSNVGIQAIREFDTVPESAELTRLLNEFDRLFN
jgi:uncharacterized protein YqcC (DUF446 family)